MHVQRPATASAVTTGTEARWRHSGRLGALQERVGELRGRCSVLAADLVDVPAKKRTAVFLACISSAAYGVFRTFNGSSSRTRTTRTADVSKIIDAFQKHCIGEANVTYKRFLFHQRVQPGA